MTSIRFGAAAAFVTALALGVACGAGETGSNRPGAGAGAQFAGTAKAGPAAVKPGLANPADVQPAPPLPLPADGSRIQRAARVTLEVGNGRFDQSLDEVLGLVRAEEGFVAGSSASAEDGQRLRVGVITFQVPAARFDDTIAALRRMGTPQAINISGTDVSQQSVDVQARLRNAEAQRDAMLALLQQARTVAEIIQVQSQLGQVTAQVEQLKGQLDYLGHTTAYATFSVTLREASAGLPRTDSWGLRAAVIQALHNFVGTLDGMIVGLGTVAPVLLVGGLLGLLGWRLRPRRRPRPAA